MPYHKWPEKEDCSGLVCFNVKLQNTIAVIVPVLFNPVG